MEKSKFAIIVIFLILIVPVTGEAGGIYGGYERDNEDQGFAFVGVVTDGKIFFNALAGYLTYKFRVDDELRDASIKSFTPTIGIRKEGSLTLLFNAGPVFREKTVKNDFGEETTTETGGFFQAGGYLWGENTDLEALVSFTTLDEFFWGRFRGKRKAAEKLYLGAEVLLMGNSDFDSFGIGPVVEYRGKVISIGLKGGYKHTSTFGSGIYTGVELYVPF